MRWFKLHCFVGEKGKALVILRIRLKIFTAKIVSANYAAYLFLIWAIYDF